ncbi:hypothetical protein [Dyadobacter sp. CY356]|uniref:hypothetical protein n=1 Tax=Dyadobacter sp. CY356 TaxID=2906442 RepID=UPI001F429BC5|nr:hypothetical protein [Dyadobacter sp. CY356]MCF0055552.1 hypothetical protein [Dyadobacter sp. CY356]
MTNIYIDIEAINSQDERVKEYFARSVKAPSNYKDPEKIQAYIAEGAIEAVNKTALDGLGHAICICVAIDEREVATFYAYEPKDEAETLKNLYTYLDDSLGNNFSPKTFIGHNLVGYDLPMLKKRSMVLGIKPPAYIPFDAKPWDNTVFDTMIRWDARNFASLDKLCLAFGLDVKSGMDGSMVNQAYLDGKHDEIASYCNHDVDVVRELHKRMIYA